MLSVKKALQWNLAIGPPFSYDHFSHCAVVGDKQTNLDTSNIWLESFHRIVSDQWFRNTFPSMRSNQRWTLSILRSPLTHTPLSAKRLKTPPCLISLSGVSWSGKLSAYSYLALCLFVSVADLTHLDSVKC